MDTCNIWLCYAVYGNWFVIVKITSVVHSPEFYGGMMNIPLLTHKDCNSETVKERMELKYLSICSHYFAITVLFTRYFLCLPLEWSILSSLNLFCRVAQYDVMQLDCLRALQRPKCLRPRLSHSHVLFSRLFGYCGAWVNINWFGEQIIVLTSINVNTCIVIRLQLIPAIFFFFLGPFQLLIDGQQPFHLTFAAFIVHV